MIRTKVSKPQKLLFALSQAKPNHFVFRLAWFHRLLLKRRPVGSVQTDHNMYTKRKFNIGLYLKSNDHYRTVIFDDNIYCPLWVFLWSVQFAFTLRALFSLMCTLKSKKSIAKVQFTGLKMIKIPFSAVSICYGDQDFKINQTGVPNCLRRENSPFLPASAHPLWFP